MIILWIKIIKFSFYGVSMYKNLKAEMLRQDVSAQNIAELLKIRLNTARLKINGKISISLDDCKRIASLFAENNDLDYLFKKF